MNLTTHNLYLTLDTLDKMDTQACANCQVRSSQVLRAAITLLDIEIADANARTIRHREGPKVVFSDTNPRQDRQNAATGR